MEYSQQSAVDTIADLERQLGEMERRYVKQCHNAMAVLKELENTERQLAEKDAEIARLKKRLSEAMEF